MSKLALSLAAALAAAPLVLAASPASAYQHRQHHRAHVQHHHVQHHAPHHVHRHVTYHAPRHVQTYHRPVYAKPVVVYTEPPRECFWAVEKHGYAIRKIWVCKAAEVKKPEVKVVEAQPAPAPEVEQQAVPQK